MSAWEYNYEILRAKWPEIAAELLSSTSSGCAFLTDVTPSPVLVCGHHQITSAFDPLDEAKLQAEGLPLDAEAVYCYGIGMGHLPAVLAARHKHACVVIMNLAIAQAAFESSEQTWLNADHVGLAMARDVGILYVPYACVPMECRLADAQGHALRDRLFAHLNKRYVDKFHFGKNEAQDIKHVEGNREHMAADKHVRELFGTQPGKPMVIVGGGPSLEGEVGWLQSERANLFIVSASTSLRFLLSKGIEPDIVVCVDSSTDQIAHLHGVGHSMMRRIALVYHPAVMPGLIEAWRGKRYYFVDELYMSGTVMHVAADLAVRMGASQVTLLGCDFCYPANQSHVAGVFDGKEVKERSTLLDTLDGHGNAVKTDFNLAHYHRHLEDYIASNPQVQWFKRGRAGVSVRGAAWLD